MFVSASARGDRLQSCDSGSETSKQHRFVGVSTEEVMATCNSETFVLRRFVSVSTEEVMDPSPVTQLRNLRIAQVGECLNQRGDRPVLQLNSET